jgi:hypothetical protein
MKSVSCDQCKKIFKIILKKIKLQEHFIHKTIFICPHCNKEYLCFFENSYTDSLLNQIKLYEIGLKHLNPQSIKYRILTAKIQDLMDKRKDAIKYLKQEYIHLIK